MLMKQKKYTIIISPSDLRPAKKVSLHQSTILIMAATMTILIFCGVAGSYKYVEHSKLDAQLKRASHDIAELREANQILMRSKEKELKVREFLGIEPSAEITGGSGQGGPGPDWEVPNDLQNLFCHPLDHDADCSAKCMPGRSLVEEALLLEDSFQELLDYLQGRNSELASIPTISPVVASKAWISSSYGYRKSPFTGAREFHSGVDISAPRGTPILATGDGTVIFVGRNGGLGRTVKIRHSEEYVTIYGHLLESIVKKNQLVRRGDVIGHMGNTGRSTGYHLHYEITKDKRAVNPCDFLLNWRDRHLLAKQLADGGEGTD